MHYATFKGLLLTYTTEDNMQGHGDLESKSHVVCDIDKEKHHHQDQVLPEERSI